MATSAALSTTSVTGLGLTGLSSGLDTSGIITKLMAIESTPQSQLKAQLTSLQTHTTALQSLNTAIAAIATTATSALSANALNSFAVTSSSSAATATASSSATAGVTQFTVDSLAQTQVSVTGAMSDTSTLASSDHSITLKVGTATGVKVTAASSSVDDMVGAINKAGAGVTASKVAAGTTNGVTQYRLQLTATSSGAAGGFSIFTGGSTATADQLGSASTPPLTTVTSAQDAHITLYPNTAAAQTQTSSTNKFTVTGGVDVTVSATSTSPVSVTVSADSTAASTSAKALTASLIQVFTGIASSSAITTSSSTSGSATSGGVFTGDSTVRSVNDALLSAVSGAVDGRSPSSIGINLTKDGTITFDQSKFEAAMAADPGGTTAMYTSIATAVSKVASAASNAYSGTISQAVTSETSRQSDFTAKISDWDTRLATIQAQYESQFNAMEIALNSLSSQSSYLTSQIAGLTTNYQTN